MRRRNWLRPLREVSNRMPLNPSCPVILTSEIRYTMTQNQFTALCAEFGIDPGIALENDAVRVALIAHFTLSELRLIFAREF